MVRRVASTVAENIGDHQSVKRSPVFTAEQLQPQTGLPTEEFSSERLALQATAMRRFDQIYIPNPSHKQVMIALEQARQLGRASPGQRKLGVRNLAPSGSGKTSAFLAYQRWHRRIHGVADGTHPIILIPLDRACTTRRLWTAVLDYFGDQFYTPRDTEDTLRKRSYACFERFGTELLGIDEVQHLAFRSTERNDVTDSIKRVLDDGVVSVALFGTDQARAMLMGNAQLANRMLPPCDIRPLSPASPQEVADFRGFTKRLDAAIVTNGLMSRAMGLDDPEVVACLFQISDGIIGRVVNLVRVALQIAFMRSAERVELCDLSAATDRWAVDQGLTPINPFVYELRK